MPLPTNTSLSLLGYSRPGDTLQSKPKQAMLVRMSSETLDALESFSTHPQVQFEFGDNPAIYIGDTHFPIQHFQETAIHEIFIRASSATKKSAPLKLHAHVIGKFSVERELSEGQQERVRESTQDAAKQRNSRSTQFTEPLPTNPQSNPRKRKEPPMFRNPLRPADKPKATQVMSTATTSSKIPAVPSQTQREGLNALRKRLIQCLVLGDRTEEQIHKSLGGSDRTISSRLDIRDLLDQLAEPLASSSTDKSPKLYRLKLSAWTEVRPYEWHMFSEPEKTAIARSAQNALHKLEIPQSNPSWDHVKYRNTNLTASSNLQSVSSIDHTKTRNSSSVSVDEASRARKQDIAKRGVTSTRETKERKTRPKTGEIMMKDESLRAVPRTIPQDDKPNRASEKRRTAESSFNDFGSGRREPSRGSATPKTQISTDQSHPSSNRKVSNTRELDRDEASPPRRIKSAPIQEEKNIASASASQRVKKNRPENEITVAELEREKRRSREARDVKRTVSEVGDEFSPSVSKRKAIDPGKNGSRDMTPPVKRRKSEHQPVSSSLKEERVREERAKVLPPTRKSYPDPNLPEKPVQKIHPPTWSSLPSKKKNETPPPKRHTTSSANESSSRSHASVIVGSQSSKSNTTGKSRRPPVYTSSEEEKEEAPSRTRPSPQTDGSLPHPAIYSAGASHSRNNNPTRMLPTDHTALRARYNTSYLEYLATFQRLVVQRGKIDHLLKNNDLASAGTITDSEGDGEILDPEELAQLATDHKKLQEELETIQQVFGQTSKGLLTV